MGKEGFFLVNKPAGVTSFTVVRKFKKLYSDLKVGHAGTLDPLASGLLIILLGKTCKDQAKFMGLDKEYQAEIIFGLESDTADLDGKIKISNGPNLFQKLALIKQSLIEEKLQSFGKEYLQTVPLYSAAKRKGKPLYWYARRGKKVHKLPKKTVKIRETKIVDFKLGIFPQVKLALEVGSGFYVRSLTVDLGKSLGVGAVLISLLRTKIGKFSLKEALSFKDIEANAGRFRPLDPKRLFDW